MVQRACLARLQACIASACATLPRLRSLQPPAGMQRIHSTKCRHTRRPRRCHALAGYRVLLPGVGLPTSVTKSGLGSAPWAIKVCSSQGSRRVQGGCCGRGAHQLETAPCKRSGGVKQRSWLRTLHSWHLHATPASVIISVPTSFSSTRICASMPFCTSVSRAFVRLHSVGRSSTGFGQRQRQRQRGYACRPPSVSHRAGVPRTPVRQGKRRGSRQRPCLSESSTGRQHSPHSLLRQLICAHLDRNRDGCTQDGLQRRDDGQVGGGGQQQRVAEGRGGCTKKQWSGWGWGTSSSELQGGQEEGWEAHVRVG